MRRNELLIAAGLAAMLMAATACGPKTTTGSAATGTTSLPPAQASGPPAAATPASTSTGGATLAASAAAGGGNGSGGAANVCSLMSSAQASAINHVTYGAAKAQHVQAGYDICTYANTGLHADPIDIQALTVTVIALSSCYGQLQQADGPGTTVAGLGDAAFGYQIGLIVNDGGRCLDISGLTHAELQNDYTHDVAMAKIIITALG
jgi:hypothetical protein